MEPYPEPAGDAGRERQSREALKVPELTSDQTRDSDHLRIQNEVPQDRDPRDEGLYLDDQGQEGGTYRADLVASWPEVAQAYT